MAAHRSSSTPRRVLAGALAAGAVLAGTAGVAGAAPPDGVGGGAKSGHLVLTVEGEAVTLPPGLAVKRAVAECGELAGVVEVDAVRAAFPEPLEVCDGVELASQVAADDDEEVVEEDVALAVATAPTNGGNGAGSSGQCTGPASERPTACASPGGVSGR